MLDSSFDSTAFGIRRIYAASLDYRTEIAMKSPEQVVQAQLDAYNAKNIDALLATYHPEAEQYLMHGELMARGHSEMRPRFLGRFAEPDLHASLLHRSVVGNFVTDHERVTRNFPEGRGHVDMLCVYEVREGLIVKASFALSEPVVTSPA